MAIRQITIPGNTNLIKNGKLISSIKSDLSFPPVVQTSVPLMNNTMQANGEAPDIAPFTISGNCVRGLPEYWTTGWGNTFHYGEVCTDYTKSIDSESIVNLDLQTVIVNSSRTGHHCFRITPQNKTVSFSIATAVLFWTGYPVRLKFKYKYTDLDGNPKSVNKAAYGDGMQAFIVPGYKTPDGRWVENCAMIFYAHSELGSRTGGPPALASNDTKILLANDINPLLQDGWRQYTSGLAHKIQGPSAEELAMPTLPLWFNMGPNSSWRKEPDCDKWAVADLTLSWKGLEAGYLYISDVELVQEGAPDIQIDNFLPSIWPNVKEVSIYPYGNPDLHVGSGESVEENPNQPAPRTVKKGWKPKAGMDEKDLYTVTHPYERNHTGFLRLLGYCGSRVDADSVLYDKLTNDPLSWHMFGTYPHYMDSNESNVNPYHTLPSQPMIFTVYDQVNFDKLDPPADTDTWFPTTKCPNHVRAVWWTKKDELLYDVNSNGLVGHLTPFWDAHHDFPLSKSTIMANRFVDVDHGNELLNEVATKRYQHYFECNPEIKNVWFDTGSYFLYRAAVPVKIYGTITGLSVNNGRTQFYLGTSASSAVDYYKGMLVVIQDKSGQETGFVESYNAATKVITINKVFTKPLIDGTTHFFIYQRWKNYRVPRSYDGTIIMNDGSSLNDDNWDHTHGVNQLNKSARDSNPISTNWDDSDPIIRKKVRDNARANHNNYQLCTRTWKSIRKLADVCHAAGKTVTINMAGTNVMQGNSYADDPNLVYPFREGTVSVQSGTIPSIPSCTYFGSTKAAKGGGGKWLLSCIDGVLYEMLSGGDDCPNWEDQIKSANCKGYGDKYLQVIYGLWTSWKSPGTDKLHDEVLPVVVNGKTYYASIKDYWNSGVWTSTLTYRDVGALFTVYTQEEIADGIPALVEEGLRVLIRDIRFAYLYGQVLLAGTYRKKNVQWQVSTLEERSYHYPTELVDIGNPTMNWSWATKTQQTVTGNPYRTITIGGLAKGLFTGGVVLVNPYSTKMPQSYTYTCLRALKDTTTNRVYNIGDVVTVKNARAVILKYI